jgi:hypothetical protein
MFCFVYYILLVYHEWLLFLQSAILDLTFCCQKYVKKLWTVLTIYCDFVAHFYYA